MYNPDKHTHWSRSGSLVKQRSDRMMPGCRCSALFKSISQTVLSHLPPRFIPSSLLPSRRPVHPVELVSLGVRASSMLTFLFLSFKKWIFVMMWRRIFHFLHSSWKPAVWTLRDIVTSVKRWVRGEWMGHLKPKKRAAVTENYLWIINRLWNGAGWHDICYS